MGGEGVNWVAMRGPSLWGINFGKEKELLRKPGVEKFGPRKTMQKRQPSVHSLSLER